MSRRKTIALAAIFGLVAMVLAPMAGVNAAGVSVTVSTPSNAEFAALTDTDVTFGFTTSATEYAIGDTITVTITPSVTSAVTDCATPTTDADGDSTADGAFGGLGIGGGTYTFTAATTDAATGAQGGNGNGIDLCLNFQNDTAAGIYSIGIADDNDGDYGAALIYVGDDNDVTVTADVQPLLSFAIRNAADTADTNACDLGVLSTAAVNTCQYRLKPATNADSGYNVTFTSDGDLTSNLAGGAQPDDEDLDPITEDTTVTAGTEGYGIAFDGGSATVGTITEQGDYNDDDTPVPFGSTPSLYQSDGPNDPAATDTTNTALMTHRAAMDNETETGNYDQVVTYYVAANF